MGRPDPECRSVITRERSPLRESRTAGSVRGAASNRRPCRDSGLSAAHGRQPNSERTGDLARLLWLRRAASLEVARRLARAVARA
jgi:hypothetical protein